MSQSMFEFHRIVKFWICFNGIIEFSFIINLSLLNNEYNNYIVWYYVYGSLLLYGIICVDKFDLNTDSSDDE